MLTNSPSGKLSATSNHRQLNLDELILALLVIKMPETPFEPKELVKARLEVRNSLNTGLELNRAGFPALLDSLPYFILKMKGAIL